MNGYDICVAAGTGTYEKWDCSSEYAAKYSCTSDCSECSLQGLTSKDCTAFGSTGYSLKGFCSSSSDDDTSDAVVATSATLLYTFFGTDSTCAAEWTRRAALDYNNWAGWDMFDLNTWSAYCAAQATDTCHMNSYDDVREYYKVTCVGESISDLMYGHQGVGYYNDTTCSSLFQFSN